MVSGGSDKTRSFGGRRRYQGGNALPPPSIPGPSRPRKPTPPPAPAAAPAVRAGPRASQPAILFRGREGDDSVRVRGREDGGDALTT